MKKLLIVGALAVVLFGVAQFAHAQIVPAQNQIIPSAYFGDGYLISTSTSPTHKLGASLIDLAGSFITGILGVANGGTASSTLTGILKGNGTGAVQTAIPGTDYQAPGNYITALTGDVTASGPGSAAATLATVNSNVGSFTCSDITVNAKGLITAAANGTCGGGITGSTGQVAYFSGTDTAVGTSTLFIGTNSRVGVGTTTPAASFAVAGSGIISSNSATSFVVGPNNLNAPTLTVDSSTASQTFGVTIKGVGASGDASVLGPNTAGGLGIVFGANSLGTTSLSNLSSGGRVVLSVGGSNKLLADSSKLYISTNTGVGSSTPGSLFSVGSTAGINLRENATSTFGAPIRSTCFTVNGTSCLSGTGGDVSGPGFAVTGNTLARWNGTSGTSITDSGVTLSDLGSMTGLSSIGIGSSTPGTSLSIGNTGNDTINISATATSTFGSGINLRTGCFAVNGTCVGGGSGSGTVGSGTTGQTPYYAGAGTTLTATSSIFIDNTTSKVGISSTSPNKTLSVGGEAFVSATTTTYGLNVFGATAATSTLYMYSSAASKGAEIIWEDVDGAGCTRQYALNGVITAESVTCPTEI